MAEAVHIHDDYEDGFIPDDSTFGARLALIRQHRRQNVKQAAADAGISSQQWGRWEDGSLPRNYQEVVEQICDRLGVNRWWLYSGSRTGSLLTVVAGDPQQELPFPGAHRELTLV